MNPALPASPRRAATPLPATLLAVLALAVALVAGAASGTAVALPPTELDGEITDTADVLGDDRAEVAGALDRLAAETPYQLFVVYVDTFNGVSGRDWANATATNTGLGENDLLLAVAVEDRAYGLSVDSAVALTDARLDALEAAAEDELRDDEWGGAVVAAVDAVLGDADSGPSWPLIGALVALVALGVGGRAWYARRRATASGDGRHPGPGPARGDGQGDAPGDADPLADLDLDELARRAGAALVAADDAVATGEQELAFARAELGDRATDQLDVALAAAREEVTTAFRRQQELDDAQDPAQSPDDRRALLREIVARCHRATDTLADRTDEIDELRDLHHRAGELLDETGRRVEETTARVAVAREHLAALAATYPSSALASVRPNPDQATTLLPQARDAVATGRDALPERTRTTAVGHLRAAQHALAQAATLLDAVESAGTDLDAAGSALAKGIASISQDLADAERRAATPDQTTDAAVAEARAAVDQARDARSGGDPLAALHRLAAAEADLDAALAPARQRAEADARANALLRDVLGRVDTQVAATRDFVTTRRGAVGLTARTRLAEAARAADEARRQQPTDPAGALAAARRAEDCARAGADLARQDTATFELRQEGTGPGAGSGAGSGGAGMVLGGILLDQLLRPRPGGYGRGRRRRTGGALAGGNRRGHGGRSRGGRF